LTFHLDGVDLGIYGSRGQQRLAILSLKLAEIEWLTGRVGSRPILLLDDVLSELDSGRQRAVLKAAAAEGQTLLTTTDIDAPARSLLPGATILSLEGGVVTELGICG
jgi:DNA replication and repair protein RecF